MKKKRFYGLGIPINKHGRNSFRCTMILLFVIMQNLGIFAMGYAQNTLITLKLNDASLEQVFIELKKQTTVQFFYSMDKIKNIRNLSVDVKNEELDNVLNRLLGNTNLSYTYIDNVVVLKDKEEEVAPKTMIKQQISSIEIKGVVHDSEGNPLPGVTVFIQDSDYRRGTNTDLNGKYSITITKAVDNKITFSMIGMETQEISINGQTVINAIMKESAAALEEVVVTGYSSIRRGDYVGSSFSSKLDDIGLGGASSLDAMLQGVVPGMLVMNTSGMVGSSPKIRVRGTSTLLGNREPLWVVDGVIQRELLPNYMADNGLSFSNSDSEMREVVSNAISWLNPSDVETITVLKDAAATAIYGSAAANGVIVVTTKKAQSGNLQLTFNSEMSIGIKPHYASYDRMNSQEMMQFSYENYKHGMSYPSQPLPIGFAGIIDRLLNKEIGMSEYQKLYNEMEMENTDWFDILFRNSVSQKYNVSVSGGSEKVQTRASIAFNQTNGEAKGNDMKHWTANLGTTFKFNHDITATVNLKASIRDVDNFAYGVDPFDYAYNSSRVIPHQDKNGARVYHNKYGLMGTVTNQLDNYAFNISNEIDNTGMRNVDKVFGGYIELKIPFLRKFRYTGLFSYDSGSSSIKSWATERSHYIAQYRGYDYNLYPANSPEYLSSPLPMGGLLHTEDYQSDDYTIRNDFVYDNLLKEMHRVTLQAGFEVRSSKRTGGADSRFGYMRERGETFASLPLQHYKYGQITGSLFDNELIENMRRSRQIINRTSNYMSGYFLGVYSYDNRYIANVSARVDASNRFGQDKNKKWQPTWSVGGKWRVGQEKFTSDWDLLNQLDLSASYGYQGNAVEEVSPFLIASTGQYDHYYQQYIMAVQSFPYPGLGWEKTHTVNYSAEVGLLKNRINFVVEYYNKVSDILSIRSIPWENGAKSSVVTGAKMYNDGYDFIVNFVPVRTRDWGWQFSVNAGKVTSKMEHKEMANTLTDFLYGRAMVDGKSNSELYSFRFKGLDENDGTPLFDLGKDKDGNDYEGNASNKITDNPLDYLVQTGKLTPDFNGGLSTRLNYKQWALQANFTIQFGGSGRLPKLYDFESNKGVPYPENNVSRKLASRWLRPGDQTNIPSVPGIGRYSRQYLPSETSDFNPYMLYHFSDLRVAKTDMIRCSQIALSYDFNSDFLSQAGISRLSMKVSMTNPFFIAFDDAWEGIDPETGNWPVRRMGVFSLSASF